MTDSTSEGTAAGLPSARLACGRDLDDVWATIDNPPDAHEQSCPYCQAARGDLADLSEATRAMVAADLADPELRADPAVLDDLMARVRTEIRRGAKIPFYDGRPAPGEGQLSVSEHAVVSLIRRVGDRHPTIRARRCRIRRQTPPPASAPAPETEPRRPSTVSVELTVSVAASQPIPALVNGLREEILAAVPDDVGLRVAAVDITVEDVFDD